MKESNEPMTMTQTPTPTDRLFTRDFTLVVLGQIISLFGNSILRFALPLYLLQQTGSAALFGLVSACSFLPMIVLSLVGGVIADRVSKRNIMVVLDFFTAALTAGFALLFTTAPLVPLMLATLMLLYGIQGAYQPSVQASIPALLSPARVLSGNAVINQISALSGLVGPVVGGWLMAGYGLRPILQISCICFFWSAVMELFIRIPHTPRSGGQSALAIVRGDLRDSFAFIRSQKLAAVMVLAALVNMVLSAMLMVGLPVVVTGTLGLGEQWLGYCQATLGLGGLLGGILVAVCGSRLTIRNTATVLLFCAVAIFPMAAVLLWGGSVWVAYGVILLCCLAVMVVATAVSIQLLAFVQVSTPPELVGKVVSCIMAVSLCAQPLGQALYGVLFQTLPAGVVMLGAGSVTLGICLYARGAFAKLGCTAVGETAILKE